MFCVADGSVRFISETIEGDFNPSGANLNDGLPNTRLPDSPWEYLLAIGDGNAVQITAATSWREPSAGATDIRVAPAVFS